MRYMGCRIHAELTLDVGAAIVILSVHSNFVAVSCENVLRTRHYEVLQTSRTSERYERYAAFCLSEIRSTQWVISVVLVVDFDRRIYFIPR